MSTTSPAHKAPTLTVKQREVLRELCRPQVEGQPRTLQHDEGHRQPDVRRRGRGQGPPELALRQVRHPRGRSAATRAARPSGRGRRARCGGATSRTTTPPRSCPPGQVGVARRLATSRSRRHSGRHAEVPPSSYDRRPAPANPVGDVAARGDRRAVRVTDHPRRRITTCSTSRSTVVGLAAVAVVCGGSALVAVATGVDRERRMHPCGSR